ncbi:hypothetical protein [Sorangium sp. So ce1099]|uniref:hypothetical protein n=1 Tax=Sorangium sp. So ce1099 TaxID=3133331 RepID=UPI003F5F51EA
MWPYAAAAVVVLAAVVLLVLWRRSRRAAARPVAKGAAPSLASAWKAAVEKLEGPTALAPVVVLFGQVRRAPTGEGDGRIQGYVAHGALVQALDWGALGGPEVDPELRALWKMSAWAPGESLAHRVAAVVVALDAADLKSEDIAHKRADIVRDKLELLDSLRTSAAPLRVWVRNLGEARSAGGDATTGLQELVAALGPRRDAVVLRAEKPFDEASVARAFEPLEAYAPVALVERSPAGFRKAVTFLASEVPALSGALARFLQRAKVTRRARGDVEIYASADDADGRIGEPLAVWMDDPEGTIQRWKRWHRVFVASFAAAVLAGTAAIFAYHHHQIDEAERAVAAFGSRVHQVTSGDASAEPAALQEERSAGALVRSYERLDAFPLLHGTFKEDKEWIRTTLLDSIRKYYLDRYERRVKGSPRFEDRNEILYAAAFPYAARDNDLGAELVLGDVPAWADRLRVPEALVRDYVEFSPTRWGGKIKIPKPAREPPVTSGDWLECLDRLNDTWRRAESGDPVRRGALSAKELADLQGYTERYWTVIDEAKRYPEAKRVADKLAQVSSIQPEEIAPLLARGEVPAWVQQNLGLLSAVLSMVKDASLGGETAPPRTLSELMDRIEPARAVAADTPAATAASASAQPVASATPSASAAAAAPSAPAAGGASADTYVIPSKPNPPPYRFSARVWGDLIARSRSGILVEGFLTQNKKPSGRSFSFIVDPSAYAAIGRAAIMGKGASQALPGVFTREAYDREVAPSITRFSSSIERAQLSNVHQDDLKAHVRREVDRYARGYHDALARYYASFQLRPANAGELRAMIAELTGPTSWLLEFLRTTADNARLDVKGNSYLDPMTRRLDDFRPIVAFMAEQDGKYPNLEKYAALLAPLAAVAPAAAGDKPATLQDVLSPMGRASLATLRGDKESISAQLDPWLGAVGIDPCARAPLLTPVILAYGFGMDEIDNAIERQWSQGMLPDVLPVLTRFPFDPKETREASIADLERLFVPVKGQFWDAFGRMIQPVGAQRGGAWLALAAPGGGACGAAGYDRAPRLPAGALDTINALAKMTDALWTKEGKPQAIPLEIKPHPLPIPDRDDGATTMSFLKTGKTSVFGFNQMPTWQPLELAWSEQDVSSIGVQISYPGTSRRRYESIDVADSAWSFYRLLGKVEPPQGGKRRQRIRTWIVPEGAGDGGRPVQFEIQGDPWSPFRVPVHP